ncbi:MAG: lycopene cyclase domain-containing protein [Deltaproteobacteria bacterium]|nr:lycopene cyclase domain-containing protein [Deltaproteobacteria bacterium]
MRISEYLIFNLLVFVPPFAFGLMKRFSFKRQFAPAFLSIFSVAPVLVIWDSLVTKRHWWFNAEYVAEISILGLPYEEILFFLTVPFACLFTWDMVARRTLPKCHKGLSLIYLLLVIAGLSGIPIWFTGKEYTALALFSLAISSAVDLVLRTRLLQQPRFFAFLVLVIIFITVFNGYLTARPVVLYDSQYQSDVRIITIPVEDYVYGIAHIVACTSFFEFFRTNLRIFKGATPPLI